VGGSPAGAASFPCIVWRNGKLVVSLQAEHEDKKVKGEKAMEVEISERYVASKKY
jgi:hypothetical protein